MKFYRQSQNNPKLKPFIEKFAEAEQLYGKIQGRKELQDQFQNIMHDPIHGNIKHGQFVRKVVRKEELKDLKKQLGSENYKEFKKFVTASQRIAKAGTNTINPSGSGFAKHVLDFVKLLGKAAVGATAIANPAKGVAMGLYARRLLTNPEILRKARKLADTPNAKSTKALENVLKTSYRHDH